MADNKPDFWITGSATSANAWMNIHKEFLNQHVTTAMASGITTSAQCTRCGNLHHLFVTDEKGFCPKCQDLKKTIDAVDKQQDNELSDFARKALDYDSKG